MPHTTWGDWGEGASFPQPFEALGNKVDVPASPQQAVLETIVCAENKPVFSADGVSSRVPTMIVRLTCPEFTSLCPVTGQPDFAHILVDYAPTNLLIESKSFKLWMGSHRNHPGFHEGITRAIGTRLHTLLHPHWLRVCAFWFPRGGIPIDVYWEYDDGRVDARVHPAIDIPHYRGR
jgi:7-cyano-7-deazaguanine reductase